MDPQTSAGAIQRPSSLKLSQFLFCILHAKRIGDISLMNCVLLSTATKLSRSEKLLVNPWHSVAAASEPAGHSAGPTHVQRPGENLLLLPSEQQQEEKNKEEEEEKQEEEDGVQRGGGGGGGSEGATSKAGGQKGQQAILGGRPLGLTAS